MRWFYYSLTLILGCAGIYLAYLIAVPLAGGLVLAFLLQPAVQFLRRWGLNHGRAVGVAMLGALLFFGLLSAFLFPSLWEQIQSLVAQKQQMTESANHMVRSFNIWLSVHWGDSGRDQVIHLALDKGRNVLIALASAIPDFALSSLSEIFHLLLSPLIAFFLLWQGGGIYRKAMELVPQRYFELCSRLLHGSGNLLGAYLRGQVIDCLAVGVILWVGLALLGMKGALAIGLLSGLLNAVPYVGPIIGLALSYLGYFADPGADYPWWAIGVIFVLAMKLDGYFIYPQTVGRSLRLNFFTVLLALMAGGALAGVMGMLLASPLLALVLDSMSLLRRSLPPKGIHRDSL